MRPNNRENHQSRPIKITRNYTKHAEGSVLVEILVILKFYVRRVLMKAYRVS